jgi:hypothetical protein
MFIRSRSVLCAGAIAGAAVGAVVRSDPASAELASDPEYTETYDAGTPDTGHWILTTDPARPRVIEPTDGNPGGYLYGEVATAVPTWSTASTRYQPGVDDASKRDSIFVGNYYLNDINYLSADLRIYQAGSWTADRTVTVILRSWDTATDSVAYEATYSLPDMPNIPQGWQRYEFRIDARSARVPSGWVFMHGDGTPGSDAEWATFMQQIDFVGFGYWKPGYAYPSLGLWTLGIDNIHTGTQR